jgi:hypothetical protein
LLTGIKAESREAVLVYQTYLNPVDSDTRGAMTSTLLGPQYGDVG